MQLFRPDTLEGTTLYMDLDVVITDNIDCFYIRIEIDLLA